MVPGFYPYYRKLRDNAYFERASLSFLKSKYLSFFSARWVSRDTGRDVTYFGTSHCSDFSTKGTDSFHELDSPEANLSS